MRIHISQSTKDGLDEEGTYKIELRGSMEVKVRERHYVLYRE